MATFYYQNMGKDGDIEVVILSGKLDTFHCDYLFDCLVNQIDSGKRKLILDCAKLDHISSLGLAMLIRAHARMKKFGGDVRLASVQGVVADVVKIVRLDRVLRMYPTVEEAIAAHDDAKGDT